MIFFNILTEVTRIQQLMKKRREDLYTFHQASLIVASYTLVVHSQNQLTDTGTVYSPYSHFTSFTCSHILYSFTQFYCRYRLVSLQSRYSTVPSQQGNCFVMPSLKVSSYFSHPPPPVLTPGNHKSLLHLHNFVFLGMFY